MPELFTDPNSGTSFDISTGDAVGQSVDANGDPIGQSSYNLTASTGRNDPNSILNSGTLNAVTSLTNNATSILGALSGQKKTTKAATKTNWLPFALAGGAILLVFMFVVARK